jgi:SAM-dependent methyltransferase
MTGDYLEVNRAHWDSRAAAHARAEEYAVERFVADPGFLSEVVRFDRPRLGDLSGLDVVHLQCHIGTDTLSLARLGARMTGIDLSPASLEQARRLAERTRTDIRYVESDVGEAAEALGGATFDLVYTGIGALCWLPDIDRWAQVVASLLRPGGRLFIREGHPMLWALDETVTDAIAVDYPYFQQSEALVFDSTTSYVDTDAPLDAAPEMVWNHGLGETITALQAAGLQFLSLTEHDSVPWNALPGKMTRDAQGEFRLAERPERLAATFTLQARLV